jgi:hypothetical protein
LVISAAYASRNAIPGGSWCASWTMTLFAKAPPAGATGTAAIYTDHVKVSHVIRRILLRQVAILNYVNPF